jgi:class 3 adenylate cyclase
MPPRTRWAKAGELDIAYQVVGDGPIDLVLVPWFVTHLEHHWEEPRLASFLEQLASFSRLILFDKRGNGLSDRIGAGDRAPTLEERMDDVRAVMDAAGSERAALFAVSEGGPLALLFAATFPERVSSLILYGTFARLMEAPDYPWGNPPEAMEMMYEGFAEAWGEGVALAFMAPFEEDERFRRWWSRLERLSTTPGGATALMRLNSQIDVRQVLPQVRVPTLVLHRRGDPGIAVEAGQYLADQIAGARLALLDGDAHLPFLSDADAVLDEVEEFLTGARHALAEPDRVLATVLFTDIVGSTERAATLGDRRWQDLLAEHHRLVREQLERYRGREVKTLGDGFLATFDGPGRGIRCARSVIEAVRELGLELRAGLHTGECELSDGDVAGIAVHIGARVGANAGPGEILVSSTVKDLVVGSGLEFADRGTHTLKGVPGEWRLYAVAG